MPGRVFAIVAHPDDIEFTMAGTLILLKNAGYEVHMMNIADGSCGSLVMPPDEIASVRAREAQDAADLLGATWHPPIVRDLDIMYCPEQLAKVAAVMRKVAPDILLVHSPQDYMEDHMNACRLAVTAAFTRNIPNYPTEPSVPTTQQSLTIYHAQPHGNRDQFGQLVKPSLYVDIADAIDLKEQMLSCHVSQKSWLDETQGMGSYLKIMRDHASEVGKWSGKFSFAEGFRRHNHLGFCDEKSDPLLQVLKEHVFVPQSD